MMESIADLRRQLAELAPDGRTIRRVMFIADRTPHELLGSYNAEVFRLVKLIHKAKPKRHVTLSMPGSVLRTQLSLRARKTGIDNLFATVDGEGDCYIWCYVPNVRPRWSFGVPATWNPEPLTEHPVSTPNKLVLLSKEECGSVPFGRVYSVRYVVFGGNQECHQLAVQASTGGTLRLVYSMKHAEDTAEELYRARFAELAGV